MRAEEHQAERTLLVHLEGVRPDEQADAAEFLELALSAGADVVQMCQVMLQQPAARYLIGTGKVGELASLVAELGVELVIFSHDLTPSQERNLERA